MERLLPKGSCGLDFGSGPGPTLSLMFAENGFPMEIYDPFYASDTSVLDKTYDFITATEVVEHLQQPLKSLNKIWSCLKPGGYLGIMTKLVIDKKAFAKWHYINDDTHICFYARHTFHWLAELWQTKPIFFGNDVILLQKNKTPRPGTMGGRRHLVRGE